MTGWRRSLYLIEILHQTTTLYVSLRRFFGCILSKFYIKPQLLGRFYVGRYCCILSKFYIKPQHFLNSEFDTAVVSYRNSTSNHNCARAISVHNIVVSYRNSTSNHNSHLWSSRSVCVVSYRNSTSNHNWLNDGATDRCVVSYRNSTSNHNVGPHID